MSSTERSTERIPVARTDQEVEALPVGSVLFDVDLDVIIRAREGWCYWGDQQHNGDIDEGEAVICLPALILHVGGEEPWHATQEAS